MKLTRLLPGPTEEFALDSGWRETLADLYSIEESRHSTQQSSTPQISIPQWLRINLILSVNGNAAGPDGTSDSLTSTIDRRILGAIRRLSDIVVVGANSVRREGYFLPKSVPLAIVTASGDLSGHGLPSVVDEGCILVLCPPDAVDNVRRSLGDTQFTVITLPGPTVAPRAMIGALRDRGYNSIVCEGGPHLAGQFLDEGIVDELCLSTSPTINNESVPALRGLSRSTSLRLTQLLVDPESVLYARWAVQNGSEASPTN